MGGRGASRSRRVWLLLVVVIGGMAAAAGVASPSTSAPAGTSSWLAPVMVSAPGQAGYQSEVAADGQGNVTAVWIQSDGTDFPVHTSSRPAGGVWSAPVALSEAGRTDYTSAQLAVNTRGDAVAVWVSRIDETRPRVESAFRPAGGDWSLPVIVSRHSTDARVAIDARGDAVAVWTRHDPNDASTGWIETANRRREGSWSTPVALSEPHAREPHVVVDAEGNALAVWTQFDDTFHWVQSADRPVDGSWGTPVDISEPGRASRWPEVALDGRGGAVAVWIRRIPGEEAVQTADRLADGSWSDPVTLSIEGGTAEDPELAVGSQGDAVVTWRLIPDYPFGLLVQAADRAAGGRWGSAVNLSGEGVLAERPDVAIDRWGNATAVWLERNANHHTLVASAELSPGGVWRKDGMHLSNDGRGALDPTVAVDGQGNAVAAWWYLSTESGDKQEVEVAGSDRAGPVSTMHEPSAQQQTARSFHASWSGVDSWSEVADFDVRYRSAPYDGGFGPTASWLTGTTTSEAAFRGAAGVNYCFSARARDTLNTLGAWSAERCAATPVDDRTLAARGGWIRASSSRHYSSTVSISQRHGAVLTLANVQTRRLDLLVTRRPGSGAVQVNWNSTKLGTFDLAAPTFARKQLVPLARFKHVRTGVLRIRVVSPTGKPVLIDGVVASRR